MRGLSLVAASGGHSSLRCAGLSLSRSTGSRRAGSVVVAHGPSCSAACGIFPDQGSNPCPLHLQADSQPLRHQGSPVLHLLTVKDTTGFRNARPPPGAREGRCPAPGLRDAGGLILYSGDSHALSLHVWDPEVGAENA